MLRTSFINFNRKGQALVEFALALPFLLTLFMGITEMGFIINDYLVQNQANAEAAKYGAKLVGVSNAPELIIGRFLDSKGHLTEEALSIKGVANTSLGIMKMSEGLVVNGEGVPVVLENSVFYMYDNNTPWNYADDVSISNMNVNVSYCTVNSTYNHSIIIPGMNIITEDSVFPLDSSNTFACSVMSIDGTDPNVGPLEGACPITVVDQPFVTGTSYVLKGKSDEDPARPGNFGWLNLDPSQPGNKNQNIADWILGPTSPAVTVPGWIGGYTGQRNAAVIKDALNTVSGRYMTIFIHDTNAGNGANLQYHEVGMAIFRLENFIEQSGGGQPYLEVEGTFVKRLF